MTQIKATTIIVTAVLVLGAACTNTETQCKRTMGMSKDGVPIMLGEPCVIAPAYVPRTVEAPYIDGESRPRPTPTITRTSRPSTPHSDPDGPTSRPDGPTNDPDGPTSRPDRPRGDNSDANGRGGNRHNRNDFTHGGTETAEDKKNDK